MVHWQTAGVKNGEEICFTVAQFGSAMSGIKKGDRILHYYTREFISLCHILGMDLHSYTSKKDKKKHYGSEDGNVVDEFFFRAKYYEALRCRDQAFFTRYTWNKKTGEAETWKPEPITYQMVAMHEGLSTNCNNVSRKKFFEHMERMAKEDIRREIKESKEELRESEEKVTA